LQLEKSQKLDQLKAEMRDKFKVMRIEYERARQERRALQGKLRLVHPRPRTTQVQPQQPLFGSPAPRNELSFERAFTANGSGSSRGFVFAPRSTPQPMEMDFFASVSAEES
jgi:hypothetical protein